MDDELIAAIKRGDLDAVRQLLERDPTVAAHKTEDGTSVLLLAIYYGRNEIAEELAARRDDLNIFEAAALGKSERVAELVGGNSALTDAYAPDGFQPLGLASFFGHRQVVELLLEPQPQRFRGVQVGACAHRPGDLADRAEPRGIDKDLVARLDDAAAVERVVMGDRVFHFEPANLPIAGHAGRETAIAAVAEIFVFRPRLTNGVRRPRRIGLIWQRCAFVHAGRSHRRAVVARYDRQPLFVGGLSDVGVGIGRIGWGGTVGLPNRVCGTAGQASSGTP